MIKMIQLLACEGVRWRISPFYSMQARKMSQTLGAARQCNHRFESFLFSFFLVHHKKLMKYSETSELCSVPSTSTHRTPPMARRTTFFHRRDVFSSFWPARLLHNRNWTRFPLSVCVSAPLPRVSVDCWLARIVDHAGVSFSLRWSFSSLLSRGAHKHSKRDAKQVRKIIDFITLEMVPSRPLEEQ